MAKIAVELERALEGKSLNGSPGRATANLLAKGEGWTVSDVVCTSGPQDRTFEERHSRYSIAIVAAGSFQYRSPTGRELMTPGSFLLGNPGHSFECGHEHGTGDRCLSFQYAPEYFERLAADAGTLRPNFHVPRLPPLRELAPLSRARLRPDSAGSVTLAWEELGIQLASRTLQLERGIIPNPHSVPPGTAARVTQIVRRIEQHQDVAGLNLVPWRARRALAHITFCVRLSV